jgi:flagellar M-ring protein FliF
MKHAADQLTSKFSGIPPARRLGILVTATIVLVAGFFAYRTVTQTDWAVLYANLDDSSASTVLAALDGKSIPFKLEANGTRVLVARDQLVTTRLALASEGKGGQAVPKGWELMDGQGLATSDFAQRVNYQRALEGELARTLMAMDPVDSATVHLTLPDKPVYAGSSNGNGTSPTASVLVKLNRPLNDGEVDTITNLVASSVVDLTPAAVTLASTDGTILHAPGDGSTVAGGSSYGLKATRTYEAALSTELTALVRTMTGQSGAQAVVRAELDLSQTTVESETIDPTKRVPTAESTATEDWTGTGANATGAVGVDGGPIAATDSNGTYTKKNETKTYTGDRVVTKTITPPGAVKKLSVAVVVPVAAGADASATPIDTAAISTAMAAAAGLDTSRGDTIAVTTVTAVAAATTDIGTTGTTDAPVAAAKKSLTIPIAAGAGAFVIMLFFVMRRKKSRPVATATTEPVAVKDGKKAKKGTLPDSAALAALLAASSSGASEAAMEDIRTDLARLANESPESLATLLSSWLAKS